MINKILLLLSLFFLWPGNFLISQQYFQDETSVRLPGLLDKSHDGEFGDLNGDGIIDVVVANSNIGTPNLSYFILNNGSGFFTEENLTFFEYNTYLTSPDGVALGDIERDGDLDVVFANNGWQEESIHHLYVNDGAAHFTDRSEAQLPNVRYAMGSEAHFADIDSDLDLDLSIFEWGGEINELWINGGTGYFSRTPEERFPSGHDGTYDAGWFDVDRDFDLDCLIVNGNGYPKRLMINDGSGWFTEEGGWRLPEDLTMSNDIEYFDVDNDGDLDAYIAAGFVPGNDRMLINNGSGYFTDESAARIPQYGDQSLGVCIGDIDNDGDFDIFVANSSVAGTHPPRIYVNDGTGHFTDETDSRYPTIDEESSYGTFGDVDGDGDLDLYVVNQGFEDGEQNRLLINVSTPDSFPPVINRTFVHQDTGDTLGPYIMMTEAWDNVSRNIGEMAASLHYSIDNGPCEQVSMFSCGGYIFRQAIGGFGPGTLVKYYMEATDRRGNSALDPPGAPDSIYSFTVTGTGIEEYDPDSKLPRSFSLSQNYPNPFNPSTEMQVLIPGEKDVHVSLTIYDLHGKVVKKLVDEVRAPGIHRVYWDGKDARGLGVPTGVYFYRMKAGDFTSTRKMTLIR
jgi:hypothetical protein